MWLTVRLTEGVHLIGGPLNRGFTVLIWVDPSDVSSTVDSDNELILKELVERI